MSFHLLSAEPEADKTYQYRARYISLKLLAELGPPSVNMLTTSTAQNQDLKSLWNGLVPVERTAGGRLMTKVRYALKLMAPHLPADIVVVRPWLQWNKALIIAKKLWGRPYAVWLDTYLYERQTHWRSFLYHEFRYGLLLRNADLIIGESPEVTQMVAKRIPKVRSIHIPVGMQLGSIQQIEKHWDEQNIRPIRSPMILYVGRISAEKRPHLAVEAFNKLASQFPDWRMKLIGPATSPGGKVDQTYLNKFMDSIEQSPYKERIEYIPGLYGEDLYRQYCEASILVQPSLIEGIPTTVVEGMYFGPAVIAIDRGAVRWQLDDGKAGIVLSPDDWDGFVEALRMLMSSPEERERLRMAAYNRVVNQMNWEKNIVTVAKELQDVVIRYQSQHHMIGRASN
jgi:glycosyltransferase involved in cell wall biosynthesis